MTEFNVGEYSVSTIVMSVGTGNGWSGLFSISKIVDGEQQQIASLKKAPGIFTDSIDATCNADEAARAFIAAL